MPVRQRSGTAATASAAGTASTATGTCTTKIACQEIAWVSSPPATGPAAVPITPAVTQVGDPAALAVRGDQELQAADQRERAAERLHAAGRDQHLDRAGQRAPRGGEPRTPRSPAARGSAAGPARRPAAVGTATSPSTRLNAISTQATCATEVSQVPQDVGQRERHHRGVRQWNSIIKRFYFYCR